MKRTDALAIMALVVTLPLSLVSAGCHESDIEPQSPIRSDWAVTQAPMVAELPPPFVVNPAPIAYRPRSISLGYVGDRPLTPSEDEGPRWPWVQEPFHLEKPYAYGYGAGYEDGYASGARRR